jgi:hypothetical protein
MTQSVEVTPSGASPGAAGTKAPVGAPQPKQWRYSSMRAGRSPGRSRRLKLATALSASWREMRKCIRPHSGDRYSPKSIATPRMRGGSLHKAVAALTCSRLSRAKVWPRSACDCATSNSRSSSIATSQRPAWISSATAGQYRSVWPSCLGLGLGLAMLACSRSSMEHDSKACFSAGHRRSISSSNCDGSSRTRARSRCHPVPREIRPAVVLATLIWALSSRHGARRPATRGNSHIRAPWRSPGRSAP